MDKLTLSLVCLIISMVLCTGLAITGELSIYSIAAGIFMFCMVKELVFSTEIGE